MEIPQADIEDYNAGRSAYTCDLRAEEGLDVFPSLAYFDEASAWGVLAAEQSYQEVGSADLVQRRLWFLAGWMWAWYERFNDPSEARARERLLDADRAFGLFGLVREDGLGLPFAVTRPCDYLAVAVDLSLLGIRPREEGEEDILLPLPR